MLALVAAAAALPGAITRGAAGAALPPPDTLLPAVPPHAPSAQHIPFRKQRFSLEMNSADTLDWQQLRGIGHAFSNRIVAYRSRLGGFYAKEQLLEVYGFTDSLYAAILPSLRLDTSLLRPIHINTIVLDSLKRHPYVDYYQAKAIVAYRQRYGNYRSPSDLLRVNLIDTATLVRLKPYLSFQ